jgi:hypothetical protein
MVMYPKKATLTELKSFLRLAQAEDVSDAVGPCQAIQDVSEQTSTCLNMGFNSE